MRVFRKILVGVLAMMGFAGCAPKVEYGCPHSTLKVTAKVVDQAGNPAGKTRLLIKNQKDNQFLRDVETEEDGTLSQVFYFSYELENLSEANVVYYEEFNPEHRGRFKDDSVTVKTETLDEGDGRWDHGDYEINVNLKLRDK